MDLRAILRPRALSVTSATSEVSDKSGTFFDQDSFDIDIKIKNENGSIDSPDSDETHLQFTPTNPHLELDDVQDIDTHHRCTVCLTDGPDTAILPCKHSFHGACLLPWAQRKFNCPLCRRTIEQFLPISKHGRCKDTVDDGEEAERFAGFVKIWERHYLQGPSEVPSSLKADPWPGSSSLSRSSSRSSNRRQRKASRSKANSRASSRSRVSSSKPTRLSLTRENLARAQSCRNSSSSSSSSSYRERTLRLSLLQRQGQDPLSLLDLSSDDDWDGDEDDGASSNAPILRRCLSSPVLAQHKTNTPLSPCQEAAQPPLPASASTSPLRRARTRACQLDRLNLQNTTADTSPRTQYIDYQRRERELGWDSDSDMDWNSDLEDECNPHHGETESDDDYFEYETVSGLEEQHQQHTDLFGGGVSGIPAPPLTCRHSSAYTAPGPPLLRRSATSIALTSLGSSPHPPPRRHRSDLSPHVNQRQRPPPSSPYYHRSHTPAPTAPATDSHFFPSDMSRVSSQPCLRRYASASQIPSSSPLPPAATSTTHSLVPPLSSTTASRRLSFADPGEDEFSSLQSLNHLNLNLNEDLEPPSSRMKRAHSPPRPAPLVVPPTPTPRATVVVPVPANAAGGSSLASILATSLPPLIEGKTLDVSVPSPPASMAPNQKQQLSKKRPQVVVTVSPPSSSSSSNMSNNPPPTLTSSGSMLRITTTTSTNTAATPRRKLRGRLNDELQLIPDIAAEQEPLRFLSNRLRLSRRTQFDNFSYDPNGGESSEVTEVIVQLADEPPPKDDTLRHLKAGASAGLLTGVMIHCVDGNSQRYMRSVAFYNGYKKGLAVLGGNFSAFMLRLPPTLFAVVPCVALFFTVYEETRNNYFMPEDASPITQFGACLLSGICGALAGHMITAPSWLVPLRYGIQFGFFESAKAGFRSRQETPRPLSVLEVGTSALLGGMAAHAVIFPASRLVRASSPNTFFRNGLQSAYRGWGRGLARFLPACLVTALGYEYSLRFFTAQSCESSASSFRRRFEQLAGAQSSLSLSLSPPAVETLSS